MNARAAFISTVVVMLLCWGAGAALGQDEQPADEEAKAAEDQSGSDELKIGVVNLGKIQQEYGELQAREKDLQAWAGERGGYLARVLDFLFLSDENFQEVVALLRKVAPTEQEKKRVEELRAVSDEKERRFLDLRSKLERTAQEEDEYNGLRETYKTREAALAELNRQFNEELGGRRNEAVGALMTKVQEAIKAEAEAQELDYVFDAEIVFFGGTDITDAVIKRLNAGQAEGNDGQEGGGDQGGQ